MTRQIRSEARLLFRIDPVPWESPRGYLCRVAYEHNYHSALSITQIAGLRPCDLEREDGLKQLSNVLRLEPEEWLAMCYQHVKGGKTYEQRLFYSERISANDLNYNRPRLCPACLRQQSIWWAIWDLGLVTACPVHRGLLFNQCPGCKRKLAWGRPAVHLCRCGVDFRELTSEPADRDLVAINMAIYRAAGFGPGAADEFHLADYSFPAEIFGLRLGTLLRLVLFVGSIKLHRDQRNFGSTDLAGAIEIGRTATAMLKDWPGSFRDALRQMLSPAGDSPARVHFGQIFGTFHGHLLRFLPRSGFGFIHEAFEEFVIEEWKGCIHANHQFFSAAVQQKSNWVSGSEAQRLAGVSYKMMSNMIRQGQVEAVRVRKRRGGRGSDRWIRRQSLNQWIANRDAERARHMSRFEARQVLGLGHCTIVTVAAAGAIRYVRGLEADPRKHSFFFFREDVMKVRDAFERHSVPMTEYLKSGEVIALHDAIKKFLGRNSGLAAVIQAVINGRLAPIAYTERFAGITGYLFLADELRRYRPVQVVSGPSECFLNYTETATRLGVTSAVVSSLVAQGLLPVAITGPRGRSKLIPAAQVQSFADQYVAAPVLASAINLSSAVFSCYLRKLAIPLVRARRVINRKGDTYNVLFLLKKDATLLQHQLLGITGLGAQLNLVSNLC